MINIFFFSILLASRAIHPKQCCGKIVIKSKNNQYKLQIPYQVHLIRGYWNFFFYIFYCCDILLITVNSFILIIYIYNKFYVLCLHDELKYLVYLKWLLFLTFYIIIDYEYYHKFKTFINFYFHLSGFLKCFNYLWYPEKISLYFTTIFREGLEDVSLIRGSKFLSCILFLMLHLRLFQSCYSQEWKEWVKWVTWKFHRN